MIALGIATIVKLILNIVLINKIGINGAIISSIVCYSISFAACFIVLKKNIDIKFKINQFVIKPIIAAGGMCVCSYWLYQTFMLDLALSRSISFTAALLIGIIIYVLLIIVLKVLDREQLFMFPYGEKVYRILRKAGIYN